ncbi:Protein EFR3 [Dissostichus eleginoides]|uniref:Protein EFR3 n=1 Tax=Dissostichus eleginoides TaxID=100907 RepID=A0AAD9F5I8_DISEL|nr:Protein EFR3 [Dissostichus eleginoides]
MKDYMEEAVVPVQVYLDYPHESLMGRQRAIIRGERTPGNQRSQTLVRGVISTLISCPGFFSHFDQDCEGDPGSNMWRCPHPIGGGGTEHAPDLALWVTSLSLRANEHIIKAHEGLNVNTR